MKIKDIKLDEMTLMIDHFPDIEHTLEYLNNTKNSKYIGDIDSLFVFKSTFKNTTFYFLSKNEKPEALSFIQTQDSGEMGKLLVAYTLPEFRRKSLAKRLLFFIKGKLGKTMIDYGALTTDGKKLYDKLNKSDLFDIKWINIKTGEKVDYINSKDKVSNLQQTDWRVLIEGSPDNTFELFDRTLPEKNGQGNSWPQFFNNKQILKE